MLLRMKENKKELVYSLHVYLYLEISNATLLTSNQCKLHNQNCKGLKIKFTINVSTFC